MKTEGHVEEKLTMKINTGVEKAAEKEEEKTGHKEKKQKKGVK